MASSSNSPSWYHCFLAVEKGEERELYQLLADQRRRTLLNIIDRSDGPVTELELARLVAARESGAAPDDGTATEREHVQISLTHVHLPQLEAAGLIERTDQDSITRTPHPLWTDSDFRMFLTQTDVAPTTITATLDSLTNRERRAILAFLYDHRRTTVSELAEELVATPISDLALSSVLIELTHRHLPKLEAVNVIEYDTTQDRVRYSGNGLLDKWFREARARNGADEE